MREKILFSAVGGHDPIASFHDGAIVHICRCYKPKKVYLYLSKEMSERSELDNRYVKTLRLLQESEKFQIEEIKLINKENLIFVHLFDQFYTEFENILKDIHTQNPNDEILVNVSSGTPAMKNALNVIAALSKYPITPIQVSTPNQSENPKEESPLEYDVKAYWECNEDCNLNSVNRCQEIQSLNLMAKIKKETIIEMLDVYDYTAALTIAEGIKEFLSDEGIQLLRFAKSRAMLDQSNMTKFGGNNLSFLPIQTGKNKIIFEYLLVLQIKQQRKEYADFIRGITPVVLDLFEECLKNQFKIDIKKYCNERKTKSGVVHILSVSKMKQSEEGLKIFNILTSALNGSIVREDAYNSMHLYWIIEGLSSDYKLKDCLKLIRDVETKIRNITAHEIVSVTDEWIFNKIFLRSAQILQLLKQMAMLSGVPVKKEYWDSYEYMNQVIQEKL